MTMAEVWNQAVEFRYSVNLSFANEVSYIYKGFKIMKEEGGIRIYNTKHHQMNYLEITSKDYEYFCEHGFKKGVESLLVRDYMKSILVLNDKIKEEVNNRNNKKHYDSLKLRRENLITKYSELCHK
jgi:hypothetical protein